MLNIVQKCSFLIIFPAIVNVLSVVPPKKKYVITSTVLPANGSKNNNSSTFYITPHDLISSTHVNVQTQLTKEDNIDSKSDPLDEMDSIDSDILSPVWTQSTPIDVTVTKITKPTRNRKKQRNKMKNKINREKSRITQSTLESGNFTTEIEIESTTETLLETTTNTEQIALNESLHTMNRSSVSTTVTTDGSTEAPVIIDTGTDPPAQMSGSHYAVAFIVTSLVFALIAYVSYYSYQRYQTRQLRLQLMPIYNYDPQESAEDWENQLLEEEQSLRQPRERIELYSVLRD